MPTTAFELLHPGIQRAIWDMRWRELNPVQRDTILAIHETDGVIHLWNLKNLRAALATYDLDWPDPKPDKIINMK